MGSEAESTEASDRLSHFYCASRYVLIQDCFFTGRSGIIRAPMAEPQRLLDRLLKTPDLATIVPHLQPEVLHRVIQRCGLEDCAELVALATLEQLTRMLDVDVWRVRAPGGDEALDAVRFGLWITVLMESGAAIAAEKLIGLDIELVIGGLARHVAVFDHAAVSSYPTLDGEQAPGRPLGSGPMSEIGGYVIEARRTSAWEAIGDLLAFLAAEHSAYFHRLMHACVRLSNGPREHDGLHDLLDEAEQDMFELACDREARRETQGYVTPAQARAFLRGGRELQLGADPPQRSPIARAYFRALEPTGTATADAPRESVDAGSESGVEAASQLDANAIDKVIELLREAGVLTLQPRALLEAANGDPSRLSSIEAYVASHPTSAEELAFLANTIMAGCSIQGRPFSTQDASDGAVAICNLGLENWPPHWVEADLATAFQVGWTVLHRDVCMYAAERLIDVIAGIRCRDRDIQLRLDELRCELIQHVRNREPWRVRNALDVIIMLDAPSWAALLALIDECPVMHAAMTASRRPCRKIDPTAFEFISQRSHIEAVHEFMASLPSVLAR
jgi:hypothetical protein